MHKKRPGRGLFWLLVLALLAYALIYSNTKVLTRRYTLAFPALPESFDGWRAAVVADCHGRYDEDIVKAVAEAEPNLIILAGDIMGDSSQLDDALDFAGKMKAIGPVCYVTGNHEWTTGVLGAFLDGLARQGVTVLDNETRIITVDGQTITLAGLADPNGPFDMETPAQVLAGVEPSGFTLLVCHRPNGFKQYAELGADLTVSGHTHGGMVRLPWIGGLMAPGGELLPDMDGGVYEHGGAKLVISRGLAGVDRFPRLFNPREVVLVTLKHG